MGGTTVQSIRLRGLPFHATEEDVWEGIRLDHSEAEWAGDWTGPSQLGCAGAVGVIPDALAHALHGRALRRSPRAGRGTSVEVIRCVAVRRSLFLSRRPCRSRSTRTAKV